MTKTKKTQTAKKAEKKKPARAKKQARLIPLAEFARIAGVSRQAASGWVKSQEAAGIKLAVPDGRRGKKIDIENPLVKNYIDNAYGKTQRGGQDGKNKSRHTIRKLQWQQKKINISNEVTRGKYIPREMAIAALDKFLVLEEEIFTGFSDRVLDKIEKHFKVTIGREERRKAKELIDGSVNSAKEMNRRIVADFKKNTVLVNAPEENTSA